MSLYDISLSLAAFLIMITMFARLNDLKKQDHTGPIWWVRRFAFVQVIGACAMTIASPVAADVPHWQQLNRLMMTWGTFWVFFTSPYQKPWWNLIFSNPDDPEPVKPLTKRQLPLHWFRRIFASSATGERRVGAPDRRTGVTDRREEKAK